MLNVGTCCTSQKYSDSGKHVMITPNQEKTDICRLEYLLEINLVTPAWAPTAKPDIIVTITAKNWKLLTSFIKIKYTQNNDSKIDMILIAVIFSL